MLKDEKNGSYNGGVDAMPLKIWSDLSSLQYELVRIIWYRKRFLIKRIYNFPYHKMVNMKYC